METGWFAAATEGSDVGRQARGVDWSRTPLGHPDSWPVALRHAVRLCYSTRFPVMLVWGPDLTLIYNDGHRNMLGTDKHPHALGAPARVVWQEIWSEVGPLFDLVLSSGQPTWSRDLPLLMRRSGFDEETFFTFSYSPLLDDDGRIAGVLDIATETTQEVVNQRRLVTVGELHATLPTTYSDLRTFAKPAIDVFSQSADISRAVLYDVGNPPRVLLGTGREPDRREAALVARALETGARQIVDGIVVKPIRTDRRRGLMGVLVLYGTALRPWDRAYERFLSGLASTFAATLRDVVRRSQDAEALRRRAARSEEESARAREVSLALQRAVLTDPPELDDLEVVVHYQPAALERDIGGDWYDAFVTPDGATTLVIGDVVGHDLEAAVAMGQLRALVRAIGYDSLATPARVLERVDNAVQGLRLSSAATATVLVARVEQTTEQEGRDVRTVRWASAGHLPPVLIRADGTVEMLSIRNDLVLGLIAETERTDHTVEIGPGDTLALYTDGLVERRDVGLRDRLQELSRVLEGTQDVALGDVLDSTLSRMLPDAVDDDIAVVAVRVSPQPSAAAVHPQDLLLVRGDDGRRDAAVEHQELAFRDGRG
ncbi:serine/threonine-protein phosphatase [Isoptericola sp. NEAU-Y5]|uniref:Serine/threonine-protein phosphatase n=1 Tax=Isoptericola luteus TaxID=2879484 RepID=A0ABS7ZAM2_9MICO|nr:PP2C family protein-serine/threonine phosphatase [Isoptericola sp. NEAU-Y5]MCA5891943.1 serine/threonine-protein phosphatase [Isoptericola sp. NEAU-Y5]